MTNRDEGDPMSDRFRSGDTLQCGSVRDLLPVKLLGLLPVEEESRVEAHLVGCGECREEASFLVRLQDARFDPPAELRTRIAAALERGERPWRRTWGWGVPAAAAVLAVALGLGVFLDRTPSNEEIWSLALQPEAPTDWLVDDWMVAGAPILQSLSDEVLREVLEELNP